MAQKFPVKVVEYVETDKLSDNNLTIGTDIKYYKVVIK